MTTLSKAEYLQRYLSTGKEVEKKAKKKKKNKEKAHATGLRIVEDDAFLAVSAKFKDVDSDEEREDIAIISSISKQVEEKAREAPKFRSSFKPLDEATEDIKPTVSTASTAKHGDTESNGPARPLEKRRSPDEEYASSSRVRRRHDSDSDSDQSPPRKGTSQPERSRKRHDSDQSPVRRRHDSDQSPVRKRHDSSESPPRRRENTQRRRHDSDSDNSSPRGKDHRSRHRKDSDSDQSPPRKHEKTRNQASIKVEVDSDQSPPRKDRSRRRKDSDSDQSPPRKRERSGKETAIKVEVDSDQSPPRKERARRRNDSSDDQSLPRKHHRSSTYTSTYTSRKRYDSDESPPRKRESARGRERRIASPEKLGKEVQQTLDGKRAGLQSAEDLKKESEKIREREAKVRGPLRLSCFACLTVLTFFVSLVIIHWNLKMFEEMDASISGRFAETTVREKQVRKRHLGKEKPEDKERKEREAKKQAELQEKYNLWNKGVAQTEQREQQLEEMARVAAEPLARMADDEEMNRHLKDILHEEDPMAAMLMSKKREKAIDRGELIYPTYQGECPPNRFGIRPGYRWDGVDRSNGFEAKLALAKNKRDAQEKEYYQNLQLYE
ncbi:hypothetical protein Y032_0664g1314 [Ancylostoma ceylanicum]|uniref:BUD13 homolog n=1 Tax=Ancylostoma ceylanicum TaxID=53326 RepID=A0A016WJT3_9BILA|nr:hypothetical protein Y032_0664g1314 [Ancylostoma ceylanicum]